MADLVQTAANVLPSGTPTLQKSAFGGEAFDAGMPVYLKDVTVGGKAVKRLFKCQSDGLVTEAACVGIAAASCLAAEQPALYYSAGEVAIGATIVVGTEYVVSAAAGKICPRADLVTGNFYTRLGYGSAAGKIQMDLKATGLQIP
jgi:hypothetical protein